MAFCWECHRYGIREASLRGSTGGKGKEYYRCSTVHDQYKSRGKPDAEMLAELLPAAGLNGAQPVKLGDFMECHHSLPSDQLLAQVDALVGRLHIPNEWHDSILAYHLDADGMARFERERYNVQKEMERLRQLYRLGHISLADFEGQTAGLQTYLENLQPGLQPAARPLIPLLEDFPALWRQIGPEVRRVLLGVMFAGLYFDGESRLRWIQAYAPFDRLLGLPEGGLMLEEKKG